MSLLTLKSLELCQYVPEEQLLPCVWWHLINAAVTHSDVLSFPEHLGPVGLTVELILPWGSGTRDETWLGARICFEERGIMRLGLALSLLKGELVGFRTS